MSPAGTSVCEPMWRYISVMNAWQKRMTSCSLLPLGSKSAPPLPAPSGRVVRAFLKTCSKARNFSMPRYTVGWKRSPPLYGPIALDISTRYPRFTRTSPRSSTQETRNEMTRSGSTNRSSTLASRYSGCRSRHSSSDPAASRTACRNSGSFEFLAVTSAIRRRMYSPTRCAPPTGSDRERRCVILTRVRPPTGSPPGSRRLPRQRITPRRTRAAGPRRRASVRSRGSVAGPHRRARPWASSCPRSTDGRARSRPTS